VVGWREGERRVLTGMSGQEKASRLRRGQQAQRGAQVQDLKRQQNGGPGRVSKMTSQESRDGAQGGGKGGGRESGKMRLASPKRWVVVRRVPRGGANPPTSVVSAWSIGRGEK